MKKILFLLFTFLLVENAFAWERVCETKYNNIAGISYFAGIHCTEDISLTGVTFVEPAMRNVSQSEVSNFIISNNSDFIDHLSNSWTCDDISSLSSVQSFENTIYSKNWISYSSTTSAVDTLTTEIEDLMETYNSEDLYNEVFESQKSKYPLASLNFQREKTKEEYFNKQASIKQQILSKQEQKLIYLFKLKETQVLVEQFYSKITSVCEWIKKEDIKSEQDEEEEAETKSDKITKYKEEFEEKLGERLNSMSRQVLQSLSVKLLSYADESPIFKRFSAQQQELVKLKISWLKAAIDSRLD